MGQRGSSKCEAYLGVLDKLWARNVSFLVEDGGEGVAAGQTMPRHCEPDITNRIRVGRLKGLIIIS